MFYSKALLSFILFSLAAVDASPLRRGSGKANFSSSTRINQIGTLNLADKDRARAQALKNVGQLGKPDESISVTNAATLYTTQVGVGSPPTDCMCIGY